ncbi:hypothetical protein SeMB42_g02280 [Synchytrium endobioticum]|uniref:Transposase n=1 Tax=Synchytrium endobioticum TaxID=286115 RepID=A0A507DFK2_9FUNG|nr:hypothetical protein SeMB42_g02280 [Synchytrium endobioticum]
MAFKRTIDSKKEVVAHPPFKVMIEKAIVALEFDPRLSGYVRAQGKSGHVLMAKRTRANRLASVLEDAGCFGAQHCQPLHAVRYCETCSTVWDRDYNAARNILYCFLYERAFAERPRPFKRV